MPSIVPGFEYDIFISYRHNDNLDGWVTEFVQSLEKELKATLKDNLSIYFDKNPHDGLLESHNVDKSLEGKLKCLVFVPIISQTYCDTKSFAWQNEFCLFNKLSKEDQFGRDIKLSSGNVASRILPIKIHDLDVEDKTLIEKEIGGALRAIEFIYKSTGINRPLTTSDKKEDNAGKTLYRDQINKTAQAVKELISAIKNPLAQSSRTTNDQQRTTNPSRSKKPIFLTIVVLLIVASTYFLYQQLITNNKQPNIDKSVAVLPFADMSPEHDQEYFGDGVAEEIINVLAQAPDLKVIARTSSFQFKGKNEDLRTIGKMLGVSTLLEGSVRKHENKIRITAQLIKTEDGTHLWSKTFDRQAADVFSVQDEIAASIAKALKATLSPQATSNKNETWNEEAYKLYQTGRYFFDRGGIDDSKKAKDYFEKSIAIDSSHSITWAYLAASEFGAKLFQKRNNKALALDSTESEALLNYALYSIGEYDHARAKKFMEKALLFSNSARVLRNACNVYFQIGELNKAVTYGKKAVEMDPLQPRAFDYLGGTYYMQKKYDSSNAIYNKVLELSPDYGNVHNYIANNFLMMGKLDEALAEIKKEPNESSRIFMRSIILFVRGEKASADEDLQYFIKSEKYWDLNYSLCLAYCMRNDIEKAIDYLQKAYEAREGSLSSWIKVEPQLDPIRNDPHFIAILKKFK